MQKSNITQLNLLNSPSFKSNLKIYSEFDSKLSGGHSPVYLSLKAVKRLGHSINLNTKEENKSLAKSFFISQN
ncbi:MAG: hypothetical protein IM600_13665 [Bacteroidetes bacterium]|nr:hypothetical protein [Bacteroidota bacterium]MCA6444473.1 hypothetical protein [Bacteroidota bacterium]